MKIKWFSLVRILGMLMVLLYHFFQGIFKGGFVGVDLFFTFSGFLTTAIFLDEFSQHKKIDLISFYRRRLYRIFPPVLLMILVVMPFTLLIRRDFIAGIGTQISAALGFLTNYYEISLGSSYENQFVPHLFLHTWTLAVEMQLYIVWGFLIWLLARFSKNKEQFRGFVFFLAVIFFLTSFIRLVSGSLTAINLSAIYYATGSHGFTFFIGAILATLTGIGQTPAFFKRLVQSSDLKKVFYLLAGGGAVLTLMMFVLNFESKWTYWLGFLLASLAASAMILGARLLHEKMPTVKEPQILGFFANLSYGIYLFHWPFLIIFSEMAGKAVAVVLSLVFSILFASLSFYIIEPLVMGKQVRLMGVDLSLAGLKTTLVYSFATLALATFLITVTAPRLGALETDLMATGLQQADEKMTRTRALADSQLASDYGVVTGTMVIGDSVTLRASDGISKAIPGVAVDGEVSRTLAGAYEIMQTNIDNNTLPQNIIIAAGTNAIETYQAELDKIVKLVPQGHRLIIVTPYDGRIAGNPAAVPTLTRDYELKLAESHNWITIADWFKVASENPTIWYYTDFVHFGNNAETIEQGQTLYAEMLVEAIASAEKKGVKTTTE